MSNRPAAMRAWGDLTRMRSDHARDWLLFRHARDWLLLPSILLRCWPEAIKLLLRSPDLDGCQRSLHLPHHLGRRRSCLERFVVFALVCGALVGPGPLLAFYCWYGNFGDLAHPGCAPPRPELCVVPSVKVAFSARGRHRRHLHGARRFFM